MAAISAGSVTYTIANLRRKGNSRVENQIKIGIPSGQTYPAGGIPLTNSSMGVPNSLETLELVDTGTSGLVFNWNSNTNKIQAYNVNVAATAAATNLTELTTAATPGAITLLAVVEGW